METKGPKDGSPAAIRSRFRLTAITVMQNKVNQFPENALIERMERVEAALARFADLLDLAGPRPTDLLTRSEIEATLKLSRSAFWQLRRSGDFPAPAVGGHRPRWTRAAVEAYVNAYGGR